MNDADSSAMPPDVDASLLHRLLCSDIFEGANEQHLQSLLPHCKLRNCLLGESLFKEGEPATQLYLVAKGALDVQMEASANQIVTIFHAKPGFSVGWSCIIPPRVYTGSCVAGADSEVIVISGEALEQLCELNHEFGFVVLRALARIVRNRLRETQLQLANLIYWIRE